MLIKHSDIMFGALCYVSEAFKHDPKKYAVPISTLMAALDEGVSIEQVAEQYGISTGELLQIIQYVSDHGTS